MSCVYCFQSVCNIEYVGNLVLSNSQFQILLHVIFKISFNTSGKNATKYWLKQLGEKLVHSGGHTKYTNIFRGKFEE